MITKLVLTAGALSLLLGTSTASAAAPAVATTNVNLRAGPSTYFPVVRVVPKGGPMITFGCLPDHSWCDVRFAGVRGWLSARYIFLTGPKVVVGPAVVGPARLPIVRDQPPSSGPLPMLVHGRLYG